MKYNGNEISENLNAIIKKNLFDYTFKTFVISKNILIKNGDVEIFYDDLLIGKATLKYSNSIIPTFTQKILNINDSRNQIKIRFTKPMTIGVDETRFTLENVNGYSKNCNFDSNKIILTCENINSNYPLRLYSHTDCGGKEELDFLVYSYSKPNDNIQFSKKYFLLSKNKASISFSMTYTSVLETFPIKVHINWKDPSDFQVNGNSRIYIYKTNKAGEYIFSYLDSNKKNITRNDVKFQVRNQLNDYYSKIEIDKKCVYKSKTAYLINNENIKIDDISVSYDSSSTTVSSYSSRMSISKKYLSTGKTTISLVSGNNIYTDWVYFTDLRAPINTYSVNKIVLNCDCALNNLYIGQNVNNRIKLNCDSIVRSGKLYCETEETLSKGYIIFMKIHLLLL